MGSATLNTATLWDRYCRYFNYYSKLGISLDISRMRFADDFIQKMGPAVSKAFAEMEALENGEIANPDENRMVGHYWLRTPEKAPTKDITSEIQTTFAKIKQFAADIHSGKIKPEKAPAFTKLLVIGIGGSALGPQLVADALGTSKDRLGVIFCDNTDPDGILRVVKNLGADLKSCLVVSISKSGGTPETRNGTIEIAAAFAAQGLKFAPHVVAVTCAGSKLDEQAKSEGWLARFPMWDWVGGRTSLFSAVGLLPAALQGVDIDAFIAGGHEMDAITRIQDSQKNPAALLALMWHFAGQGVGKKDMVVLPYKDRLVLFSKYLQQLVMESLGKEKDLKGNVVNQGIAVYGNKGSTDQHAYVQQLRDGLNNFFVTFISALEDFTADNQSVRAIEVEPGVTSGDYLTGFWLGTRRALYENSRDSISITIDRIDTKTLGALIALYERAVSFYASMVGINAYHQPGVEAGKKAAAKVLDIQKSIVAELKKCGSAMSALQLATSINQVAEVETVFHLLEHLSANKHSGISRIGERHPASATYRFK